MEGTNSRNEVSKGARIETWKREWARGYVLFLSRGKVSEQEGFVPWSATAFWTYAPLRDMGGQRPTTKHSTSATTAVITFLASLAPTADAHPTGFLDFLYPARTAGTRARQRSYATTSSTSLETKEIRPRRVRRRPRSRSRRTELSYAAPELDQAVPPKYELDGERWILAEDWLLHGKRRNEVSPQSLLLLFQEYRPIYTTPVYGLFTSRCVPSRRC